MVPTKSSASASHSAPISPLITILSLQGEPQACFSSAFCFSFASSHSNIASISAKMLLTFAYRSSFHNDSCARCFARHFISTTSFGSAGTAVQEEDDDEPAAVQFASDEDQLFAASQAAISVRIFLTELRRPPPTSLVERVSKRIPAATAAGAVVPRPASVSVAVRNSIPETGVRVNF